MDNTEMVEDSMYEKASSGGEVEHLYDKPNLVASPQVYNTAYDQNFSNGQPIHLNIYPNQSSFSKSKTKYWIIGGVVIGILLVIATVSITLLVVQNDDSGQVTEPVPTETPRPPASGTTVPTTTLSGQSGEWLEWSAWSECSVSCDTGEKTATRECSGTYCSGRSSTAIECREKSCTDPMEVYGSWSTWTPWRPCSETCGYGTQSRTRDCIKKDEQEDCLGHAEMQRECTNGACLEDECATICEEGDLLDCVCVCTGQLLSGTIVTKNGEPVSGVAISHADIAGLEYDVSDENGAYSVSDICPGTPLSYHRDGFVTQSEKYSKTTHNANIILTRFNRLAIQRESRRGARLVGGCITLDCDVSGTPIPDDYEWFKNGNMTSIKTSEWTLTELTEKDSGLYYCRASNDYSAVYTHGYAVRVRNSSDAFCTKDPTIHIKQLPTGCLLNGGDTIDVGRCYRRPCSFGNETCQESTKSTCGVSKYARVSVHCGDFTFDIFVAEECGCIPFQEPMYHIRGIVVSAETLAPVRQATISINETQVAQTSNSGEFAIEGTIESPRLVLTIDDPKDNYAQLVTVVELSEDNNDVQYMVLKVPERLPPIEEESSNMIILHPGNNKFTTGFSEITIFPDSLYNKDGTRYNGRAEINLEQYDPRNTLSIESAPGDFSAVDVEGEDIMLLSTGMFRLDIKDSLGNDLNLAGRIRIAFDGPINTNYNDGFVSRTKLWKLNGITGKWDFLSDMTLEDEYRTNAKNLSHQSGTTDWGKYYSELNGIDIGRIWTNFDFVSEVACHTKIRVFDKEGFWDQNEVQGAKFSVLILDNEYDGIDGNIVSKQRARTDNGDSNGYCLVHPCDSPRADKHYGFKGYIVGDDRDHNMLTPHHEDADHFPSEIEYRKRDKAIEVNFDLTATPEEGPFYDWNRNKWMYSDDCSDAGIDDRHFRFYRNPLGVCAVTEFNAKDAVEGIDETNFYAWNTGDGYMYIKVLVESDDNHTVQARSVVGEINPDIAKNVYPLKVDQCYGVREDCTENRAVCLEGKVSGLVTNGSYSTEYGDVLTTVNFTLVNATGYNVSVVANNILNGVLEHDITVMENGISIKIQKSRGNDYSKFFGIYVTKGDDKDKKNEPLYACRRGTDSGHFDVNPPNMTDVNWAFKFNVTYMSDM